MMPLGLTPTRHKAYLERLLSPHDYRLELDVLRLDEKTTVSRLTGDFLDGQVNLQRPAGGVARTATFTLHDPAHAIHLDPESPVQGAIFFDRMVRVRHIVEMPWGPVTAIPFVGPMTKLGREADTISIECQDKAILAMEGRPPITRKKGHNAVDAITDFLRATGERKFRILLPDSMKGRRLKRPYSCGWSKSPWRAVQAIAENELGGAQAIYSCDGFFLLRRDPNSGAAVTLGEDDLTSSIKIDYDASSVRNHVRVTGSIPAKQTPDPNDKKPQRFTETATARKGHPMAPSKLGRNGASRYLPLLVDDDGIRKHETAKRRAEQLLDKNLPLRVTTSWSTVPVFHLDTGDQVLLKSDRGDMRTPLLEASIPLGLGGDASMNHLRKVSRPQRTGTRARQ